jgi:transposase
VPGASVAKVAMSHGINANIVHGWRKLAREAGVHPTACHEFVPVAIAPALPVIDERSVDVELHRGATTIKLSWPLSAAGDLACWMRELLR